MSHGPFGLGGGTLAPACPAIVDVAPIIVSANISTRFFLGFMFCLGKIVKMVIVPVRPTCTQRYAALFRQQRLYLRPLPHGQISLRPILGCSRRMGCGLDCAFCTELCTGCTMLRSWSMVTGGFGLMRTFSRSSWTWDFGAGGVAALSM